jgi:hypothetical protein
LADGRTALSQHRRRKASNSGPREASNGRPRNASNGRPRNASNGRPRKASNRRPRRSVRAFLLTTVVSAIFVAAGAEYVIGQLAAQPNLLAESLAALPASRAGAHLVHERQHMILMAAATGSLKIVGKPKVATKPAPPSAAGGGGGGAPIVYAPVPSPGTAQSIAYNLLPSFGFDPKTQFGCLKIMWENESGWRVTAANASGAYGIPQALPGSKMASAGPNWQTNATTQIKWGLGYIKGRYGTPCGAWAFWQNNGWY